jgi:hypothetical protein
VTGDFTFDFGRLAHVPLAGLQSIRLGILGVQEKEP